MNRSTRTRSRGFTLIELMMAMVVGAIVLTGVFAFASIQQSTAGLQHRRARVNHALEGAMWAMARDVRMAGFGFSRQCSEIRIWVPDLPGPSGGTGRLVNPGAADVDTSLATDAAVDPITGEPYWVLRDGIQAHWRSSPDNDPTVVTTSISGGELTSASRRSAADSFDVVLAERNMGQGSGTFRVTDIDPLSSSTSTVLRVTPAAAVTSSGALGENSMRQMFPPGSFVLLSRAPALGGNGMFQPTLQSQCVVVQVTGEGRFNAADFELPLSSISGFNQNLEVLLGAGGVRPNNTGGGGDGKPLSYTGNATFDWGSPVADNPGEWMVSPLGRLRWSRYEIDYSVQSRPYLVRTDFISHVPSVDGAANFAATLDYPGCAAGSNCPLPQIHLPGGLVAWEDIPRVAIGPMIEDMQVAVGCDGYTIAGAANARGAGDAAMSDPDLGFEERIVPGQPAENLRVDEWPDDQDKGQDEWLGNAVRETFAPDCVYYGTGEYRREEWASNGPALERVAGPAFRMSPQMIRITLLAKPDVIAPSGNAYEAVGPASEQFNRLFEIEDRLETTPEALQREYYTLTETFAPKNLRWRDTRL